MTDQANLIDLPPTSKLLPDSRITDTKNFYFQWYRHRTTSPVMPEGLTPPWAAKEAKLCKDKLRYIDQNSISFETFMDVLGWFMQSNDDFIKEKSKFSFAYFCQDFHKFFLEARKNMVNNHFPDSSKPKVKPVDPIDNMTWVEKRKHFDQSFHDALDSDIKERLEKMGPRFITGLMKHPMLSKLAPAAYRERLWAIAKELWPETVLKEYVQKGKELQNSL